MSTSTKPPLALVVPCFNEEPTIAASLDALGRWFPDAVIVAVDDGSTDQTATRIAAIAAANPCVRLVRLGVNRGKGAAVAAAAPAVLGHDVVVVDADLAYGERPIRRAIAGLAQGDLAVGNRRHADSRYTVPVRLFGFLYRRHVLGLLFNVCVRLLLGITLRDTQCGLKAFRADAFQAIVARLRTARFAYDLEVLLIAQSLGLARCEVPVELTIDSGRSSVRLVRDGVLALREILGLAMRRALGRYRRSTS
jgi:glycosyltransferase involved in cell wall biosynthesis